MVKQIAENLWQLTGWPRDMFNVYLAGDVLIDAATRWAKRRILRQLRGRTVRMVALTHCHPDHQGTAHFLCEHFWVPLAATKPMCPRWKGGNGCDLGTVRFDGENGSGPVPPIPLSEFCGMATKWRVSE